MRASSSQPLMQADAAELLSFTGCSGGSMLRCPGSHRPWKWRPWHLDSAGIPRCSRTSVLSWGQHSRENWRPGGGHEVGARWLVYQQPEWTDCPGGFQGGPWGHLPSKFRCRPWKKKSKLTHHIINWLWFSFYHVHKGGSKQTLGSHLWAVVW